MVTTIVLNHWDRAGSQASSDRKMEQMDVSRVSAPFGTAADSDALVRFLSKLGYCIGCTHQRSLIACFEWRRRLFR